MEIDIGMHMATGTVADLGFWKGGFQCAHDWSHKLGEARALGGVAHRDMSPRNINPSEIVFGAHFGVKQRELDSQLPNLVIVFEAFQMLGSILGAMTVYGV